MLEKLVQDRKPVLNDLEIKHYTKSGVMENDMIAFNELNLIIFEMSATVKTRT